VGSVNEEKDGSYATHILVNSQGQVVAQPNVVMTARPVSVTLFGN